MPSLFETIVRTFICDEVILPWPANADLSRPKELATAILSTVWCLVKLLYWRVFMLGIVFRVTGRKERLAFGRFLVCFAVIGIGLVVFSLYACLLPLRLARWRQSNSNEEIWWILFHVTLGHIVLLNLVVHFMGGVWRDPGTVPQPLAVEIPRTMCTHCQLPRPLRAHHCSVCERCVLRMDHHCPWLNNCVGLRTHRHFYFFLAYLWIGIVYLCLAAWGDYMQHTRDVCNAVGDLHVFAPQNVSNTVAFWPALRIVVVVYLVIVSTCYWQETSRQTYTILHTA